MVHALKEAHRVLVPHGIMIDVRPLSTDCPLEVIFKGGSESAGMIDMSPGVEFDRDADRAIEAVVTERTYNEIEVEYFDFTYYWKTVKGMQEDIEEHWKGEVIITDEVWRRARMLFKKRLPGTHIRVIIKMKLGKYLKNG